MFAIKSQTTHLSELMGSERNSIKLVTRCKDYLAMTGPDVTMKR